MTIIAVLLLFHLFRLIAARSSKSKQFWTLGTALALWGGSLFFIRTRIVTSSSVVADDPTVQLLLMTSVFTLCIAALIYIAAIVSTITRRKSRDPHAADA